MHSKFQLQQGNGFSLLEVVIVISILFLLASISLGALQNMYRHSALKVSTNEVYRAFTDARNRTLASEGDNVYGVLVGTSSVTRFVGSTYSTSTPSNKVFAFKAGVTATGTIVRNKLPIVFERLTGEPSASGTILMRNNTNTATNTITIYSTGLVEY